MKHGNIKRKLGRERNQRRALIKSLLNNFVKSEKMQTTEAKAKELRPKAEKLITKAKRNTLADRRAIAKVLEQKMAKKLCEKIAPKYVERHGGYTRIIKIGRRKTDASPMAIIELV